LWFKIFFAKWRFKRLIKSIKKESKSKANRKYCERLLQELSSDYFKDYQKHMWATIDTSALYLNIEEYSKRIKDICLLMKNDRPLPSTVLPNYHAEIPLTMDQFLTTNGGYYVNVENAILEFKNAGIKLCTLLEKSDGATEGVHEHNFRMLTKLFINVQQLTETLIEVSLLKNK